MISNERRSFARRICAVCGHAPRSRTAHLIATVLAGLVLASVDGHAQGETRQSASSWAPAAWPRLEQDKPSSSPSPAPESISSKAPTAGDLLRQADRESSEGRVEAAVDRLERLVQQFPRSPEAVLAKDRLLAEYRKIHHRRELSSGASAAGPSQQGPSEKARASYPGRARSPNDDFKTAVADRVFFDPGDTRIDVRQQAVVSAQAAWLREHPRTMLRLAGHADDPGPRDLNDLLAQQRAEAVRDILLRERVSPERIEISTVGNGQPIARCGPDPGSRPIEPCASQNRRVVSEIQDRAEEEPRRRPESPVPMARGRSPDTSVTPARATRR